MASKRSEQSTELVQALSFGSVANQYERYRLDYPDELVDAVVQYAGGPVRTALEVGAGTGTGTGKATRLFASRGIEVTVLEPAAEMAHVLERTTRGIPAEPVVMTFEEFGPSRRSDPVYAAAAWHSTDPARPRRAKPGMKESCPHGLVASGGDDEQLGGVGIEKFERPSVGLQVCIDAGLFPSLAQRVIGEQTHDGAQVLERGSSQLDDRRGERQGR